MRQFAMVCVAALVVLTACKGRMNHSAYSKPTEIVHDSVPHGGADAVIEDKKQDETMGHGEVVGIKTVRGKLYHSKGRLGELNGMIISGDFLTGSQGGNWKPEYEALVGKEVEAMGEHYRYICGPIEQCLEGGVINYLRALEYLRAVE
jgi:hypothetical protein